VARCRRDGEEGFWLKKRSWIRGVMVMRVGEGGFGNVVVEGVAAAVGGGGFGRIREKERFCAMEGDVVMCIKFQL